MPPIRRIAVCVSLCLLALPGLVLAQEASPSEEGPQACTPLASPSQTSVAGNPCGDPISVSANRPTLAWSNVANEIAYAWEVYAGAGCTGALAASGTTAANTTSAVPPSALPDGVYSWQVAAVGDGATWCDSPWNCGCPFTVCTALPAPASLSVSVASPGALTLTWSAVTGATSYRVYVSRTGCGSGFTLVGSYLTTSATLAGLCPGGLYLYRVTAVGSCESPPSVCRGETPEGTCRGKIFESDFELGGGSFTDWVATGLWQKVIAPVHGGSYSAWTGNAISQDDTLTTANPVYVQPGTAATLSFWSNVSLEAGYDFGVVEVSRGPHYRAWEPLTSTNNQGSWTGNSAGAWSHSTFDLSAYAGITLLIRFRVHTDGGNAQGGWWVDDVKLGACGPVWTGLKTTGLDAATCDRLTLNYPDAVSDSCAGGITYNAYRSAGPSGPWTMITSCGTPTTATSFADTAAQPGSLQYYRVRASSTSNVGGPCGLGAEDTNTRTASSFVPPFTAYFSDSFEGGFAGPWLASANWNVTPDYWADGSLLAHSGNALFEDDALTTAASFRLPDGSAPSLFFLSRQDIEPDFDWGVLQVATGPAFTNWATQTPVGGAPVSGAATFTGQALDMREMRCDLSAYAGQRVKFRFFYHSDGSNSKGGWWVDKVRLVSKGPTFAGLQRVNSVQTTCGGVRLDWTAATTACAGGPILYHVYRSTDPAFVPSGLNRLTACPGISATYYTDTTAVPDTQYYYAVRAEQQTGATGGGPCGGVTDENTVRVAGSAQPESILFHDPFEGGSFSGMWQAAGGWAISTLDAFRGASSAWSGGLSNQNDALTLVQPIRVVSGGSTRLTFWSIVEVENNFDWGQVQVAVGPNFNAWTAVTPSPVAPVSGAANFTGSETHWRQYAVDLTPYAGNDVKVRFYVHTDGANTFIGWFLDDVKVVNTQVSFAGIESAVPDSSCNSLVLSWAPVVLPCTGTAHYNVYRSTTLPFTPGPANRVTDCSTPPTGTRFVDTGLTPGSTYYYTVRAEREGTGGTGPCGGDEDNNTVVRGATVTADQSLIVSDHFEGGLGKWTVTGGHWVTTTGSARSLANSAWSTNAVNVNDYLTLAAPFVPTANSTLSFFAQWGLEAGYDYGRVQIYDPTPASWSDLTVTEVPTGAAVTDFTGTQTQWREYRASLAPYVGKSIQLRFYIHADGSNAQGGWYLDDVKVTDQPVACGSQVCAAAPTFAGLQTAVANPSTSACGVVRLGWNAGTPGCSTVELHYNVYRSTISGSLGTRISACSAYGTTYDDMPPASGTYYYTVRAEDSSTAGTGPCGGREESNLVQRPVAFDSLCIGASVVANNLCRKDPFSFRDATIGGTPSYTHAWSFGDGVGTSTQANPKYAYSASGNFTVTHQVQDSLGATASTTLPVTVAGCVWGTMRSLRVTKDASMQAVLTWTAPTGTAPSSYNIYRATTASMPGGWPGSFTLVASVSAATLTWTDTNPPAETKAFYIVVAVNALGQDGDPGE